ncbi:hypothetical protein ACFL15_00205 [Patescibacteria group bacterium]
MAPTYWYREDIEMKTLLKSVTWWLVALCVRMVPVGGMVFALCFFVGMFIPSSFFYNPTSNKGIELLIWFGTSFIISIFTLVFNLYPKDAATNQVVPGLRKMCEK